MHFGVVRQNSSHSTAQLSREKDRPDGHDPRDQYIGHKRIDTPIVKTSGSGAVEVAAVRLNCHRLISAVEPGGVVYVRRFSLHKRHTPWD